MWLAQEPNEAGDIAFYKGSAYNPIDKVVMLRTGSDIVHVAVFDGDNTTIAATSNGITRQNSGHEYKVWRPRNGYAETRLDEALFFLRDQIGQPYGWADIANQVLLLSNQNPVLLDKSSDCSDLATKFLWIAGVALPYALINTNRITPGGLYSALDGID